MPAERALMARYKSGATHSFLGEQLSLSVIPVSAQPRLCRRDDRLILSVVPGMDAAARQQLLFRWYRAELQALLPARIAYWEPILGVRVDSFGIKHMKTRWGTCNPRARRIWLNLELARRLPACLEYVLVHEMVHILEPSHNARFKALMDSYLPSWRAVQDMLNTGKME